MAGYYAAKTKEISQREKDHMKEVRGLAGECMTLLENDGTLPLKKTGKIALYGNGARRTVKGGTGSGNVNSRSVATVEEGLKEAGFTITTQDWLDEYDRSADEEQKNFLAQIKKIAEESGKPEFGVMFSHQLKEAPIPVISSEMIAGSDTDTAIYVIARNSGEGCDRHNVEGDYLLSKTELEALKTVAANYKNTIVILNVANIIDTTALKEIEGIGAILLAGQAGNIGGYAVADVLIGKTLPSGKLTDTWAKAYADYPSSATFSHNNGDVNDEYYEEGIFVGYRYFDTFNITPNYCFGYGKGYTDFSIETIKVQADAQEIRVSVKVTNTGTEYAGREVVQVYYSAPDNALEKPYQELAGFAKTKKLMPGESQELTICYKTASMASYDEKRAAWVLEKGIYYVRVGNSSRNTRIASALQLEEEVLTVRLKNLFADTESLSEIKKAGTVSYSYPGEEEEKAAARIFTINAAEIGQEMVLYSGKAGEFPAYTDDQLTMADVKSGKASLKDLVSQLTVEEMAEVCKGAAKASMGGDASQVVGNASHAAPGAAGETVTLLQEKRGIRSMVLADGPAGLRLTAHFGEAPDGKQIAFTDPLTGRDMKDLTVPEGTQEYYQYCTAIPVAALLAQSWDMELIEKCGEIVGREMEEFHVSLWLAPGMNIHRNPLCGRNFEYYSEDPLISGMCAAATTLGVQSHAGTGTTIKHYAANNMEDNRMFVNEHISERAIREIYLKGFEIAVKTSQPMSIMSSYNLLNGIHTAGNYDLLTAAARDEWGFAGLIMTDWGTSEDMRKVFGFGNLKYSYTDPAACVNAGNDLQMPGSDIISGRIVEGVKNGEISLGQLQLCTWRILNIVAQSLAYKDCKPYGEQFGELPWVVKVIG